MSKINDPIVERKYKVTGHTRVILIDVEHEEEKIQWACNKSIYTDAGETENFKEVMPIPNGHLWKISAIFELKKVCQERHVLRSREEN